MVKNDSKYNTRNDQDTEDEIEYQGVHREIFQLLALRELEAVLKQGLIGPCGGELRPAPQLVLNHDLSLAVKLPVSEFPKVFDSSSVPLRLGGK